jgi:hypothetical protein
MLGIEVADRPLSAQKPAGDGMRQLVRFVNGKQPPEPCSLYEVAVIMGPAMNEFEREQAAWNAKVAHDKANRGYRCPSAVPLRALCLVAYLTLMRPKNNKALTWEEVKIDPQTRTAGSSSISTRT